MTQALRGGPRGVGRRNLCCALRATLVPRGRGEHLGFRIAKHKDISRVIRGSGWFSDAHDCRLAYRYDIKSGGGYITLGFRLARRKP